MDKANPTALLLSSV